ncbi:hypothetical protein [Ureibacillus manganicus]|uniref:Uncharacterized protein n=1 Tax=Ureibacillus manganicus DSM 26584 TaxID=1384049 RepID=A0A0A3HQP0_9BACL|nr:hypothetical protein [Ureibacillus manganicus]KGR73545.1 hypothetical protein CD29_19705 [Ureibacillus manganicus DSM 26584]
MLGWIIVGLLVGAVVATGVVAFWDDIRRWLNNTAANFVEKYLGYGARNRMHRAVTKIDKVMNVIKNQTVIYTKRNRLDTMFDKVTMEAEANPYEIDNDVLQQINKEGKLVQEFEYRQ